MAYTVKILTTVSRNDNEDNNTFFPLLYAHELMHIDDNGIETSIPLVVLCDEDSDRSMYRPMRQDAMVRIINYAYTHCVKSIVYNYKYMM